MKVDRASFADRARPSLRYDRRVRSRVPVVAFVVASGSAIGACTVVSGWSDLMGGAPPPRDGGAAQDADSRADDDAKRGGGSAVLCAAHHCSAGEGCCAYYDGGGRCSSATACDPGAALWVACTERRDCNGGVGAVCCLDDKSGVARCASACSAGELQLCARRDEQGCPAGMTCDSIGAPPALSVCRP